MMILLRLLPVVAMSVISISALAVEPTWKFETVAPASQANRKVALRIDRVGTVHLAFTGCAGAVCNSAELMHASLKSDGKWNVESLDSSRDTGWFAAMETDLNGGLHIFYADHAHGYLHYATRTESGRWSRQKLGTKSGGWWNASSFSRSGGLWMANTIFPEGKWELPGLEVGSFVDGKWAFEMLDHGPQVGWFPSMALDPLGLPVITYEAGGYPTGDLRLVHRLLDGKWQNDWIDSSAVKSSVAVDSHGVIHVAYQQADSEDEHGNLMYARSETPGKWEISRVNGSDNMLGQVGYHPQLVLDTKGGVHIFSRTMKDNCLAYSHMEGKEWKTACAGPRGNGGLYPAAEFDSQGRLHVAFDTGQYIVHGVCTGCATP